MVSDEEIKTNISPFAMREGEIKTFDGKDGYVSINQIINKVFIRKLKSPYLLFLLIFTTYSL